jgi:hypothetical protein
MEEVDQSHFLIYCALGVTAKEGRMIDIYQNIGRFLYKYAGSFLEEGKKLCFKYAAQGCLVLHCNKCKRRVLKFSVIFYCV